MLSSETLKELNSSPFGAPGSKRSCRRMSAKSRATNSDRATQCEGKSAPLRDWREILHFSQLESLKFSLGALHAIRPSLRNQCLWTKAFGLRVNPHNHFVPRRLFLFIQKLWCLKMRLQWGWLTIIVERLFTWLSHNTWNYILLTLITWRKNERGCEKPQDLRTKFNMVSWMNPETKFVFIDLGMTSRLQGWCFVLSSTRLLCIGCMVQKLDVIEAKFSI